MKGDIAMEMIRYRNLDGDSGITAYGIGNDYIVVEFHGGACYIYSYMSAGTNHVENMKALARQGRGLNSYIMRNVKNNYERKYKK